MIISHIHRNIIRFEVTVNYAMLMGMSNRLKQLQDVAACIFFTMVLMIDDGID